MSSRFCSLSYESSSEEDEEEQELEVVNLSKRIYLSKQNKGGKGDKIGDTATRISKKFLAEIAIKIQLPTSLKGISTIRSQALRGKYETGHKASILFGRWMAR